MEFRECLLSFGAESFVFQFAIKDINIAIYRYLACCFVRVLTLNLLTTTIVAPPSNASKWQMGFNSAFKGLNLFSHIQGGIWAEGVRE
jgi:hypothetical protein